VPIYHPADLVNGEVLARGDLAEGFPHRRLEPHAGATSVDQNILAYER
jgi:hypothetical protein